MRRVGAAVWRFFGGPSLARTGSPARRHSSAPPVAASAGDDAKRFRAAVRRYGLSETDLRRRHRHEAVRCHVLLGGALFAASFGATGALVAFGPALAALAALLALLFLAAAAGHSLRAWQIRERRLGAFGEWARTPAAWFPPFFS